MNLAVKMAGKAGMIVTALLALLICCAVSSEKASDDDIIRQSLGAFLHDGVSATTTVDDILNKYNIPVFKETLDVGRRLIDIGKAQYRAGDTGSAIDYFKKALLIINDKADKSLLCDTLKELGLFFKENNDNDMAIEYLTRGVDVSLLTVDDKRLQDLLAVLEDLFKWQETVGKDPAKPPMPEAPPQEKTTSPKVGKKPSKTPITEGRGAVLPCEGPYARNKAYADLPVKSEWSSRHLNPIPGGRYAPYATDTGLDILTPRGNPAFAAMGGIILYSAASGHVRQRTAADDQGAMRIRHPNGTETFYAHLSGRRASLSRGVKVRQGQWMANVGVANRVAHLHFTIYYPGGSYEGPFSTPKKLLNPWPAEIRRR